MRSPRRWLLFILLALGVTGLTVREHQLWATAMDASQMQVSFLDVPGGSATLIVTSTGKTVLIGGGKDISVFRELGTALPFFHRTIDLLVIADARMVSPETLTEIANRYNVRRALMPSPLPGTLAIQGDILTTHKIPITEAVWDQVISLDTQLALTMTYRTKSKPVIVTITHGEDRIDIPGTIADPLSGITPSMLHGTVSHGEDLRAVIIRDTKETAFDEALPLRNVAKEGSIAMDFP